MRQAENVAMVPLRFRPQQRLERRPQLQVLVRSSVAPRLNFSPECLARSSRRQRRLLFASAKASSHVREGFFSRGAAELRNLGAAELRNRRAAELRNRRAAETLRILIPEFHHRRRFHCRPTYDFFLNFRINTSIILPVVSIASRPVPVPPVAPPWRHNP